MPLVAHNGLPSLLRLGDEGQEVLNADRAVHQDIRELHIGLLNLMPDAALEATERQFMRLVGASNRIAQFYVHPFSIPGLERGEKAQRHIEHYYETFAQIQKQGLDALIISGANPANPDLSSEGFWPHLLEVIAWAKQNVCSTLYSCLATHAAVKFEHHIERQRLQKKCWGVYSHRLLNAKHPLVSNINTRFDAPHSHVYEVSQQDLESAGLSLLVTSEQAGVYLAVSHDQFRHIYFQGHPEYDSFSLLKEFKREALAFQQGLRADFPVPPENYFNDLALDIIANFRAALEQATDTRDTIEFPELELLSLIDNTWTDTGKAIFNNWLGLVYQLTNHNRKKLFMEGIDPDNSLGILR